METNSDCDPCDCCFDYNFTGRLNMRMIIFIVAVGLFCWFLYKINMQQSTKIELNNDAIEYNQNKIPFYELKRFQTIEV